VDLTSDPRYAGPNISLGACEAFKWATVNVRKREISMEFGLWPMTDSAALNMLWPRQSDLSL